MAEEKLLEIKDLHVTVDGTEVLKGVSLSVGEGEIHALFGPNGSGKTTLLNTVIGFARYHVTQGSICFKGQDITHATIDERARLGVGISFQRPPTIRGVTLRHAALAHFVQPPVADRRRDREYGGETRRARVPRPRDKRGALGRRDEAHGDASNHPPVAGFCLPRRAGVGRRPREHAR